MSELETPNEVAPTPPAAAGEAEERETAERDELAALREALADREAQLAAERERGQQLVARVREALLASDPAVAPELVTGERLEEVEASFAQAQELVRRVRDSVAREAAFEVPAGAPGRVSHAPATAFEKIRAGLAEQ